MARYLTDDEVAELWNRYSCGRDRQILRDYHPGIRVIIPTEDGVAVATIDELLPGGFVWAPTVAG